MKKITAWKRKNEEEVYEHNHIEEGWIEGEYPVPSNIEYGNKIMALNFISDPFLRYEKEKDIDRMKNSLNSLLKTWKKYYWKKEFCFLNCDYQVIS